MIKNKSKLLAYLFGLVIAFVLLFVLLQFQNEEQLAEFEVRNVSMAGVLDPGQNIEVDFSYYERNEVERGDVVLFSYAGNDNYLVKTVYAVPGDIVDIEKIDSDYRLLINGRAAVTSEGNEFRFSSTKAQLLSQYVFDYKNRVPDGAYLLLGNVETGSLDSSQFGFVSAENIVGKVVAKR